MRDAAELPPSRSANVEVDGADPTRDKDQSRTFGATSARPAEAAAAATKDVDVGGTTSRSPAKIRNN